MQDSYDYKYLLSTASGLLWQRMGAVRRAGVAVPLFSLYSSKSMGIGDLFDLKLLVDWCEACAMSIIQLLPMNDVGFTFRPYDAQSTFALDPVYLALGELIDVDLTAFKDDFNAVKQKFSFKNRDRVDYGIKSAKLKILWKIFKTVVNKNCPDFETYIQHNSYWLDDYALFKVIKEKNNEMSWEGWSEGLKHRNPETISVLKAEYREDVRFHQWLQWQLFSQFRIIKDYARKKNVFLFGDLPFLVSRDSADVWSHQDYFKLDLASGAPADMLYSKGQRWGMPPYNWHNIANHSYDYLKEKLKYAQNFYDLYRIDHVVGIFRVWTISLSEPLEHDGLNGVFDPPQEELWEQHGRNILSIMVDNADMLACAEDLGTVPDCCFRVLEELGIPGIDIQRWMRDWKGNFDFKNVKDYRKNSLAVIATHDMSNLCAWWKYEAATIDKGLFERKCAQRGIAFETIKDKLFNIKKSFHGRLRWKKSIDSVTKLLEILELDAASADDFVHLYRESFDEKEKFLNFLQVKKGSMESNYPLDFIKKALYASSQSASIFNIQLIFDWLFLGLPFTQDPWSLRINYPGTMSDENWSQILPLPLENMLTLPLNNDIKKINKSTQRC
ncbi:MAG: 4-alpha-glucanotransferase [Candidatus Omnitrophota bacterium]